MYFLVTYVSYFYKYLFKSRPSTTTLNKLYFPENFFQNQNLFSILHSSTTYVYLVVNVQLFRSNTFEEHLLLQADTEIIPKLFHQIRTPSKVKQM